MTERPLSFTNPRRLLAKTYTLNAGNISACNFFGGAKSLHTAFKRYLALLLPIRRTKRNERSDFGRNWKRLNESSQSKPKKWIGN